MVPLFAAATQQQLPVQVWYCSNESLKETLDVQFGTQVKWDIPLLEGYTSEFITNNAKKPSIHNGFWGLYNKALIKKLKHAPPSLVIVPGWNYASYWMAILAATNIVRLSQRRLVCEILEIGEIGRAHV